MSRILNFSKIRFHDRTIAFALLALILCPAVSLKAMESGLGIGVVEEGDDRLQPSTSLRLEWPEIFGVQTQYWGQKHGPYRDEKYILTFLRSFPVESYLSGALGLSYFHRRQLFKGLAEELQDARRQQSGILGIYFGLNLTLPFDQYFVQLGWHSHVFPAGINAILLTTGRVQNLAIAGGFRW